jgi:radical SAM family uncharacterized protein/radical SAM-linked protein
MSTVQVSQETLDTILAGVDKPARYTGGEVNSVVKEGPLRARLALAFPDVYEVAESHIGLKILYHIVNERPDLAAERVYALWPDCEQSARRAGVPLWSLETRRALADFDCVGFTLQYELSFTAIVAMLDHGGIPVRATERGNEHPFVIGGGAGAYNPEPVAPFFDAFLLGDGEQAILEIMDVIAAGRERRAPRVEILTELARLDGIYVPSHYELDYDGVRVTAIRVAPGTPKAALATKHGTPRVTRVTLPDLDALPYPTKTIVPNLKPVHDRIAIEIQRGCSQACRFCQAGMITRPTRQRKPATVLRLAEESLAATGCDEVGLLSLSAGDYEPINEVLAEFFKRYRDDNIGVSLPSMRTETMTPELAAQVATVRKSGFTFAPEAGSERMRKVINKTNSEEDLMRAVRATVTAGWRLLKFYFMIGLPTETDADVDAIAHTAERALAEGRKIRGDVNVTVSVSTFVPKPHTSFQWEQQIGVDETREKHRRLRDRLKKSRIAFRYHTPEQSYLEGVLSRGDRRLADAIELAAREGARFDAWSDHYDHAVWMRLLRATLAPHGLEPADYLKERPADWLLPWDHLDAGILKKFLQHDRKKSYQAAVIEDCAFTEHCYACGGCDLGDPYKKKNAAGERLVQLRPLVHGEVGEERPSVAAILATTSGPRDIHHPPRSERTRLRFRYAKLGRAFHQSHLDVQQHVLRAVRLAGLPVIHSNGFNPRPRIGFTPACPTGVASEAEYFEIDCAGEVEPRSAAELLKPLLPDGLFILDATTADPSGPGISELVTAITWVVGKPEGLSEATFRAAVAAFRGDAERWVRVTRKEKRRLLDARREIKDAVVVGDKLQLTTQFHSKASLRIVEAIAAILGPEVAQSVRIRKTQLELGEAKRDEAPPAAPSGPVEVMDLTSVCERTVQNRPAAAPERRSDSVVIPYAE